MWRGSQYPGKQLCCCHLLELGRVDVAVAVPVEDLECLPELRGVVLLLRLLPHHLQELIEVDGAVTVDVVLYHEVEHLQIFREISTYPRQLEAADLVLGGVLAHGPHHGQQLLGGDGAAPVLPSTII